MVPKFEKFEQKQAKEKKLYGKVFIFPTLQMNSIKTREDEEMFTEVLKHFSETEGLKMDFCSGYLNPMDSYINILK